MQGQGLIVGMTMIAGFFGLSAFSIYSVTSGTAEVDELIQLYEGLGKVAAMTGIPAILGFFLATRGQTSGGG